MTNYFKNWNFMRVVRLLLGTIITIQGVQSQQWLLVIFGAFVGLSSILNMGCCSANACAPKRVNKPINQTMEDIQYEEVR
jgi:hypothetical protein